MQSMRNLALAGALAGASLAVQAQAPTTIGCPTGSIPTKVDVDVVLNTTATCPLLQDPSLRRHVDRFAPGTTFAFPAVPGTCISGTNLTGTITPAGTNPIPVTGQTWSAQTLFPEAASVGNGLTITGVAPDQTPFLSGAAVTFASLRSPSGLLRLDLLFADRFTLDLATSIDTEEFVIIGSSGLLGATGRLTGLAKVGALPIANTTMEINGTICLR